MTIIKLTLVTLLQNSAYKPTQFKKVFLLDYYNNHHLICKLCTNMKVIIYE